MVSKEANWKHCKGGNQTQTKLSQGLISIVIKFDTEIITHNPCYWDKSRLCGAIYSLVNMTESVRQIICPRWDQLLMHLPYWCQWKHNAYVIATVPKENLLVWNLKEGWEPLCKFLNKPIPNEPIPHDNRTGDKEFMERYILNKPIFKEVFIRNHISPFYIADNHL